MTREEAGSMKVTNVRGVLVATIAMDSRDFGDISRMSDAELVLRAKQAMSTVVPAHMIRDILVGRDGDVLEVAFTV
jgi:hypothetical protein